MKYNKFFALLLVFSFFSFSAFAQKEQNIYEYLNDGTPQRLSSVKAKIGNNEFELMIARGEAETRKGLMFRTFMPENHGMIFVYNHSMFMSFWMKNTILPLDLIFIAEDLTVSECILNMLPGYGINDEDLPRYSSEKKAKYAIELNKGTVERLGIKVGDKLEIPAMCLYSY